MEVIILIIVLCFLFSSQKKKSQKVGKKETSMQNRPVTEYRPQTQSRPANGMQSSMQRSNMQDRQAAVRTAGGAGGSMAVGNKAAEKKPASVQQEWSTTEMLGEKAKLDEMEHREEKRRQLAEERRIHGQLHYAERYLPGDMVPKGRRLVSCSYCNAENLIPERDNPKRYNCYFCRETL